MNKKYIVAMFLVALTLSACSSSQPPADSEWSSESMPEGSQTSNTGTSENVNGEEAPTNQAELDIQAGTWTLDVNKSIVTWTGSKVIGSAHTGTVAVKEGDLIVGEQGPTSGEFVMDMTTIQDVDNTDMLVDHLKGDDFFGVEQFPESKFVITKIESLGGDQFEVTGDLTIRETTKPITFEATAQYDETEKTLAVKADFQINRTDWDINFNSSSFFQNLGDNAIKDEIDFNLDLGFYLNEA